MPCWKGKGSFQQSGFGRFPTYRAASKPDAAGTPMLNRPIPKSLFLEKSLVRRDKRSVKEQVKSGLFIAGKLVTGFCIAAAFLSGCGLIREATRSTEIVIGCLLITLSIAVIAFTV